MKKQIGVIVFGSFLLIISCNADKNTEDVKSFMPSVKTLVVSEEEFQPFLESYGNLTYTRKADITVSVEGTYEQLLFEEGDRVTAGTEVARLSNIQLSIQMAQARSAVTSAEARLALAQARYEEGQKQVEARLLSLAKSELEIEQKRREVNELTKTKEDQETLFKVGGVTEANLRNAELSLLSAQTELQKLEKDFEIRRIGLRNRDILDAGMVLPDNSDDIQVILTKLNTRTLQAERDVAKANLVTAHTQLESAEALQRELSVKSPITGIIGTRSPEVGEKASPGDSIYTVFETENIHVVFPVQEADALLLAKGMGVQVRIDAFPRQLFEARIDRVSPVVDPQSGNVTVRALVINQKKKLQPGMFARVSVEIAEPESKIFIPETALFEKNGTQGTVYVIRNNKAFAKQIHLGRQYGERLEVIQNLKAGELIIDKPSPIIQEGMELEYE